MLLLDQYRSVHMNAITIGIKEEVKKDVKDLMRYSAGYEIAANEFVSLSLYISSQSDIALMVCKLGKGSDSKLS